MSADSYVESAHSVDVEGVRFPVVLARPSRTRSDGWRIVVIAGSQHADVDGNVPVHGRFEHVYADLSRQLAANGHSVVRYAKHGPKTGSIVLDDTRASAHGHFRTRVTVAAAILGLLERITPSTGVARVALAGHSEGSIVATILAAQRPTEVGALICLSGPAGRRLDNVREHLRTRLGLPERAELSEYDALVTILRAGQPLSPALFVHEQTRPLAAIASDPTLAGYIREVDEIDPSLALQQVPQPTLVVHGDGDVVVGP